MRSQRAGVHWADLLATASAEFPETDHTPELFGRQIGPALVVDWQVWGWM